jgi:molybdenum cofactor cytidylyltransferase
MGEPKQLLSLRGRPLLETVIAAACDSTLDEVVVVLGAHAEQIRVDVDFGRARIVVNPNHAQGMSTSLRAGVGELGDDIERVAVVLGDQPDISAALLDRLLETQVTSGLPAAALSFDGLLHPPMVLARTLWTALDELTGDVGLRALVRAHPELVAALAAGTAGDRPIDIDTPEDYQRLSEEPA